MDSSGKTMPAGHNFLSLNPAPNADQANGYEISTINTISKL
jgi:hypothetical protein